MCPSVSIDFLYVALPVFPISSVQNGWLGRQTQAWKPQYPLVHPKIVGKWIFIPSNTAIKQVLTQHFKGFSKLRWKNFTRVPPARHKARVWICRCPWGGWSPGATKKLRWTNNESKKHDAAEFLRDACRTGGLQAWFLYAWNHRESPMRSSKWRTAVPSHRKGVKRNSG